MTGTAVYLYAVTRGPDRPVPEGLTGVSGTPIRTVEHAGLAAVVSSVPLAEYGADALRDNLEDLVWLEQTARAHHAVVMAVAQVAATAPVRLTTIFHDGRRVAGLLDDRGDQIRQALARVAGHAEWGVKVYGDSRRPSPEPEPITAGSPGTAYLRQRSRQRRGAEQAARQLAAHAGRIHDSLAARATAVHTHRPQDPRLAGHSGVMLSNTAYLVADRECVGFTAARGAAGRRCDRRRGRGHRTVARLLLRHPPGPVMHPDLSGTQVALVDLLDRLLAGGVVLSGDLIISIAGVDLVRVSLRALITSIAQELR